MVILGNKCTKNSIDVIGHLPEPLTDTLLPFQVL